MTAPLEHMLRNAVAHGLEKPDKRKKAGKPEEGTIRIAVRREGSEVVLEVSDDGAGLNRDAIRKRGEERGLVRSDAVLSDGDLDVLIFEPGFSTADEVSRLAGRGVGMDVVASEVRQLGGTLDIHSTPGRGHALHPAPAADAGGHPGGVRAHRRDHVRRADRLGARRGPHRRATSSARPTRPTSTAARTIAVHDLGNLVGHAPAKAEGQLQMPLLLVRAGDLRAAVSVDQVVGNREIVVKPVGPQVASVPGIFGATIMGDGSVVVILDVAPLVRRQALLPRGAPAVPAPAVEQRRVPLVMVVDDSVTMRKVTGRVLERHNFEVATAKDGLDALEKHGRARARPDAARHRDAAHGRLRAGDRDEGRSAPAQRADHDDHLAYRREASPARVRHRRQPLPGQAVPGAGTDAQRVRTAGAAARRRWNRHG